MSLQVSRLALETIATLRPLVARIRRHDRSLAVELVRAASSTVLTLGESAPPRATDPGPPSRLQRSRSTRSLPPPGHETHPAFRRPLAAGGTWINDVSTCASVPGSV